MHNLDGLLLLIHAVEAEGRHPVIVDRTWHTKNLLAGHSADLDDVDYIVVEDDTWQAWMTYNADRIEDRPLACVICGTPGAILCDQHR